MVLWSVRGPLAALTSNSLLDTSFLGHISLTIGKTRLYLHSGCYSIMKGEYIHNISVNTYKMSGKYKS